VKSLVAVFLRESLAGLHAYGCRLFFEVNRRRRHTVDVLKYPPHRGGTANRSTHALNSEDIVFGPSLICTRVGSAKRRSADHGDSEKKHHNSDLFHVVFTLAPDLR